MTQQQFAGKAEAGLYEEDEGMNGWKEKRNQQATRKELKEGGERREGRRMMRKQKNNEEDAVQINGIIIEKENES